MTDHPIDHDTLHVYSGVSQATGAGFVTLRWGEESGQLTPEEARAHALHLLACAEAAENDAVTVAVLLEEVGSSYGTAMGLLASIRERRSL